MNHHAHAKKAHTGSLISLKSMNQKKFHRTGSIKSPRKTTRILIDRDPLSTNSEKYGEFGRTKRRARIKKKSPARYSSYICIDKKNTFCIKSFVDDAKGIKNQLTCLMKRNEKKSDELNWLRGTHTDSNFLGPSEMPSFTNSNSRWEKSTGDARFREGLCGFHQNGLNGNHYSTASVPDRRMVEESKNIVFETESEFSDQNSSATREAKPSHAGTMEERAFSTQTLITFEWDKDELICDQEDEAYSTASDSEIASSRTITAPEKGDVQMLQPVIASLFPHTPPVLRFVGDGQKVMRLPDKYAKQLKWRSTSITPNVVRRLLKRSHFTSTVRSDWICYFGGHLKPASFQRIKPFQKVNHFPGSFRLGRKDNLWHSLCRFRAQFGRRSVNFVPRTFCLPNDLGLLRAAWNPQEIEPSHSSSSSKSRWIIKPPAAARGIGVKVVYNWCDLPKQRNLIVQSYIAQPYLINGTKFDLRLYVYVTSFYPLKAYMHREGIVRFASEKYTTALSESHNRFIHLTNYSVNKYYNGAAVDRKWELETLWYYLLARNVDVHRLWIQIKEIVFKSLAAVTGHIALQVEQNCKLKSSVHELFGFDILLDENLKPWLLEVNVSPSLHTSTTLDNNVKSKVVTDMFNIAGYRLPPERHPAHHHSEDYVVTDTKTSSGRMERDYSIVDSASASMPPCRKSDYSRSSRMTSSTQSIRSTGICGLDSTASSSNSFGSNTLYPVSDTRLWASRLSCNEKQKHLQHSRLESIAGVRSAQRSKHHEHRLLSRISRSTLSSLCRRDSLKPNNSTNQIRNFQNLKDELRSVLDDLTPDDVRTLIDFVDERYRASLGNFEPIYPLGGEDGSHLFIYLEGCSGDEQMYPGIFGSRAGSFRYYDVLLFAFMTVYHRPEYSPPTFRCHYKTDASYLCRNPDYSMLTKGHLSMDDLDKVSCLTGFIKNGLLRLTNLCNSGYHLLDSESIRSRTMQNDELKSRSGSDSPCKEMKRILPSRSHQLPSKSSHNPMTDRRVGGSSFSRGSKCSSCNFDEDEEDMFSENLNSTRSSITDSSRSYRPLYKLPVQIPGLLSPKITSAGPAVHLESSQLTLELFPRYTSSSLTARKEDRSTKSSIDRMFNQESLSHYFSVQSVHDVTKAINPKDVNDELNE